jgi:hypothetical protein
MDPLLSLFISSFFRFLFSLLTKFIFREFIYSNHIIQFIKNFIFANACAQAFRAVTDFVHNTLSADRGSIPYLRSFHPIKSSISSGLISISSNFSCSFSLINSPFAFTNLPGLSYFPCILIEVKILREAVRLTAAWHTLHTSFGSALHHFRDLETHELLSVHQSHPDEHIVCRLVVILLHLTFDKASELIHIFGFTVRLLFANSSVSSAFFHHFNFFTCISKRSSFVAFTQFHFTRRPLFCPPVFTELFGSFLAQVEFLVFIFFALNRVSILIQDTASTVTRHSSVISPSTSSSCPGARGCVQSPLPPLRRSHRAPFCRR